MNLLLIITLFASENDSFLSCLWASPLLTKRSWLFQTTFNPLLKAYMFIHCCNQECKLNMQIPFQPTKIPPTQN